MSPKWSLSLKISQQGELMFYKFILYKQFILCLHFNFCLIFYLSLSEFQRFNCRINFDIIYIFCFSAKKSNFLNFSHVLNDAVLLGNRHWTFRNNLLISYHLSTILRIFRSMKICLHYIPKRRLKLPGVTASHLTSNNTECSGLHPEWNWRS